MKRMHIVPSNFTFGTPVSGSIVVKGCFAVRQPDDSIEYDDGDGTIELYKHDPQKSSASKGIHYVTGFKGLPPTAKRLIKFPTKLTAKPADFWIDLYGTRYKNNAYPSIAIDGYGETGSKDSDIPMVIISRHDGVLGLSDHEATPGNGELEKTIHANHWSLYENKDPDGFIAELAKMGITLDKATSDDEGEPLFKLPPELYGFDAANGCVTIDVNSLPHEFVDHVRFHLYACPLEKILD